MKPPEPEKAPVDKTKSHEVIEYVARKPPEIPALKRPPFDTPLVSDTSVTLVYRL